MATSASLSRWSSGFDAHQSRYRELAQLGEHLPYKQEVMGSSPMFPIYINNNGDYSNGFRGCPFKAVKWVQIPYRRLWGIGLVVVTTASQAVDKSSILLCPINIIVRSSFNTALYFYTYNRI